MHSMTPVRRNRYNRHHATASRAASAACIRLSIIAGLAHCSRIDGHAAQIDMGNRCGLGRLCLLHERFDDANQVSMPLVVNGIRPTKAKGLQTMRWNPSIWLVGLP
jgi:hypothetical protein